MSLGLLRVEVSLSHNAGTLPSVGFLCASDRLVANTSTWQKKLHLEERDIYTSGGNPTRHPSKRRAADPRLRLRGHRDRLSLQKKLVNIVKPIEQRIWNHDKSVLIKWSEIGRESQNKTCLSNLQEHVSKLTSLG